MNKVFIALLLTCLPCLASNYEVYYPSTMSIINTGFTNYTYCSRARVAVDGIDGNKRVLYTGYIGGIDPRDDIYSFTFIPSKNVKGKVIVGRIQQ